MALAYDVRAEYQSMSLEQLLDSTVNCFEGVGDTQSDLLNRYFGITTVRQLANMPYFLWTLGIQELALKGIEISGKPVNELAKSEPLKFSIQANAQGKNPVELFNSTVNVLDGLTPAQNLALYNAFRVTNVVQLAHNRIMLEARVIEYLHNHPELASASEAVDKDEIASILGADTVIPTSGEEAQEALTGDAIQDGLRQKAGEIGEHLRGRIDALKDRAAERARSLGSREATDTGEMAADVEQARQAGGSPAGRMDALRAIRERTETTRVQSISERIAQQRAGSPPAAAAAGTADVSAGAPGMTVRPPVSEEAPPGTEGAATDQEEAEAGLEQEPAGEEPQEAGEQSAFKPWMAAAAAAVVVLIGLIWWLIPGKAPVEETPPVAETSPPEPQQAVAPPAPPPPDPGPPIRTIHTVVKGQSLWRIARFHYRRPVLWPKIYGVNQDQIEDPDLIYPDQELKIPELE
ncbi:MAG: LysM peptidoglycan-binding domain-containing protein [SAR324 cluster bacterium]|nr:LysM peptidoglycan-binding domain-containing protein [SAR324 cluster bacterium]MCZ6557516.1 LysM peptidoglycan-binding domain-containing protein [SAR324 cluster bacterium]